MESCLWTTLYVPLRHNLPHVDETDEEYYETLMPGERSYREDKTAKQSLLFRLTSPSDLAVPETSALYPYRYLLQEMAEVARGYYLRTLSRSFKGYSREEEVAAIDRYIHIFEQDLIRRQNYEG